MKEKEAWWAQETDKKQNLGSRGRGWMLGQPIWVWIWSFLLEGCRDAGRVFVWSDHMQMLTALYFGGEPRDALKLQDFPGDFWRLLRTALALFPQDTNYLDWPETCDLILWRKYQTQCVLRVFLILIQHSGNHSWLYSGALRGAKDRISSSLCKASSLPTVLYSFIAFIPI